MDRFDVIIIGMGCGGMTAADRLLKAGRRVAVIERELIGGECAYWACIPPKTLLRGPEVRAETSRAAGVTTPAIQRPELRDYHDCMVSHVGEARSASRGHDVVEAQARDPLPRPAARGPGLARLYGGAGFLSAAAFGGRR